MSNEISTEVTQADNDLLAALTETKDRAQIAQGDIPFLKMTKAGEWVYGSEDTPLQEGSIWALNPRTFAEGFIAWGEGEVVDERMASSLNRAGLIIRSELPELPSGASQRGWEVQKSVQLQCTNGEDAGTVVLYKTTSVGGKKAFTALLSEVVNQGRNVSASETVPLCALSSTTYQHKKWGATSNPIFTVKGWMANNAIKAPEVIEAPVAEAAPVIAAPTRAVITEAPEVIEAEAITVEAPEPVRKRRRAVAT